MQYITDAREAKEIDRISMEEFGIDSMVLMERAALAAVELVREVLAPGGQVLAVCGMGNNGGDGVAAARILQESGFSVAVSLIGNEEHASAQMKRQLTIARNLGMRIFTGVPSDEYTMAGHAGTPENGAVQEGTQARGMVIMDALFGIGLSREAEGEYAEAIHWMNEQEALRIALDIPSGVSASTGEVLGAAVTADWTVTFGTNKRGNVLFPGCNYAGQVRVCDIGFPQKAVKKVAPRMYTLTGQDGTARMPERILRSNKGSYGKVLVIAGSKEISGACCLSAAAAYRMGCGLVKVFTAQENGVVIKSLLPEALVTTYDSGKDYTQRTVSAALREQLQEQIQWASCIVIGPGIGTREPAGILLEEVLKEKNKAVVIDADGLNVLAGMEEYFVKREDGTRKICLPENMILTPHLQEMARLTQTDLPSIRSRIVEHALVSMEHSDCQTLVLKDAKTVVTDGKEIYINTTGNSALSTGGTGDVLSGMIGGLLAQGMKPKQAAVLAVCLHGMAADEYVRNVGGRYSMMAGDLLEMLPRILPK